MKRRIIIVAIFLLAGAVVNVAVAWGCVITSQKRSSVSILPWPDSQVVRTIFSVSRFRFSADWMRRDDHEPGGSKARSSSDSSTFIAGS